MISSCINIQIVKSIHTYSFLYTHFYTLIVFYHNFTVMLTNQINREPIQTRNRQRSQTPAATDQHLGIMEDGKRNKRQDQKQSGGRKTKKMDGLSDEQTGLNDDQSEFGSEQMEPFMIIKGNGKFGEREGAENSEMGSEDGSPKKCDDRPALNKVIDSDGEKLTECGSDKENEGLNVDQNFETVNDRLGKTLETIDAGIATNKQICDIVAEQANSFEGKNAIEMLQSIHHILQQQTAWMCNNSIILGLIREEILQPYVALIGENVQKRLRPYKKPTKADWKKGDIIIQLKDESQHAIANYTRDQIKDLVMLYQDACWPEPKIGEHGLKEEIQRVLSRYYALVDQPRKIGYIVSQFLHKQEYFTRYFISKYYASDAPRKMEMERRIQVPKMEKDLFKAIVLYICGCLVAKFPATTTSSDNTLGENKQMDFLNSAREAVNQEGLSQREGKKPMQSYMEHVEDFEPLLEREEFQSILQAVAVEDESSVMEERKKSGQRALLEQQSPTTSRTTNIQFAQILHPQLQFSPMASPSSSLKSPKSPRLSSMHAPPIVNLASPHSSAGGKRNWKTSFSDAHSAAQEAYAKAMKEIAKKKK